MTSFLTLVSFDLDSTPAHCYSMYRILVTRPVALHLKKKIDIASVFAFSFLSIISCQSQDMYVLLQMNDSIVTKTTITVPVNGGPVEAVSTMETVSGYWTGSRKRIGETALTSLQYLILDSHVQMRIMYQDLKFEEN